MKAVVLVAPLRDFYFTPHRFAALGARTVVRGLQQAGVDTVLLTSPLQNPRGRQVPLPRELAYLTPFLIEGETGKLSYFTGLRHFGPSFEDCARQVADLGPDVVFLACFAFAYARDVLEQAEALKKLLPRVPLIAGGAGVSVYPEYFLRGKALDYAFRGEVEAVLPALVEALRSLPEELPPLPQLYRRREGRILVPERELAPLAAELDFIYGSTRVTPKEIYLSTSLSRGCPGQCRFCINTTSGTFKVLPLDKLQAGLDLLHSSLMQQQSGPSRHLEAARAEQQTNLLSRRLRVNFEDDNLLYYKEDFFRILKEFRRRFPNFGFFTENGIDYTRLDPATTTRLLDYGLGQFNLSLGALEPTLQLQETRPALLERYSAVLQAAAARQIPCISYFICGFRNETLPGVAHTLGFLAGRPTLSGISLFYAIPGLPDFSDRTLFDRLHPVFCLGASAYPWNKSLTTAQLVTAFRLSRLVNLTKQAVHTPEERRLLELCSTQQRLFTVIGHGKSRRLVKVPGMDEELIRLFFQEIGKLPHLL